MSAKRKRSLPKTVPNPAAAGYLTIGDVAELTGVSASVIRSWERLGIIQPNRSEGGYRLYSKDDVQRLRRARFLNRVRGMNGPAIVEVLRSEGRLEPSHGAAENGFALGRRLRQLRIARHTSLSDVAKAVGISIGFLSAVERAQMSPSVGTLRKLARFYKQNILDFFDPVQTNPFRVTPRERKRLQAGPGVGMELLAWGKAIMEPHLFSIAPGAESGESYTHEGEEFLYVIRGALTISLDGHSYQLKRGDSFYFESTTPHNWHNSGKSTAVILWINTPPTF